MKTGTLLKRVGTVVCLLQLVLISSVKAAPPVEWPVQASLLQKQMERLEQVASSGGWGTIKASQKFYQKGTKAPAVIQIKYRLSRSGDLQEHDQTDVFTDELAQAVRRVQKRFGFTDNGVVDAALIKQLNVPVEKRIAQIRANLGRLQQLKQPAGGTWLVANVPEYKLHVYEGNQPVFDMNIVVGSLDNKTVLFNDEIQYIVFSPYWNVPPSIVAGEILPAMRRNPFYLRNNGYERVGTEDGLPKIRQKPGAKNSLGRVKFVFPNSHNIYLHDTPAKSLFNLKKRALSHGCIRLAEPAKLAEYLLRQQPEWNDTRIEAAMNSGSEQRVNLSAPVPVSITYFTAWVDKEGQLNFREDIYGMDN